MSTRHQRSAEGGATSAHALELADVSKIYEVGGVDLVALDSVDLTVEHNEVVTLLGPSGSGKTTLLSLAGGLLTASHGRVIVDGDDITHASSRRLTNFRRRQVGFIFQAVNLVPFLTARENLLVVAELAGRSRSKARRRADQLLDELGLGHRTGNLPSQLSGGERQRVAIGRALMNEPALVLVDEPTSALDSDLGQQVMELIVTEVKARGAAAVIVTHDGRMTRYGDRVLTMADGRIAEMAPRPEWTTNRRPTGEPRRPDREVVAQVADTRLRPAADGAHIQARRAPATPTTRRPEVGVRPPATRQPPAAQRPTGRSAQPPARRADPNPATTERVPTRPAAHRRPAAPPAAPAPEPQRRPTPAELARARWPAGPRHEVPSYVSGDPAPSARSAPPPRLPRPGDPGRPPANGQRRSGPPPSGTPTSKGRRQPPSGTPRRQPPGTNR